MLHVLRCGLRVPTWLLCTSTGSGLLVVLVALLALMSSELNQQRAWANPDQATIVRFESHELKFGTASTASVELPAGCTEVALDPHGSKNRLGVCFSYPDAKEPGVQLVVTRLTGQDRAVPQGEALQSLVTHYDDNRRKDGDAVIRFKSSYSRAGADTFGEVNISMLTAPNHIGWTELRALEVCTVDGNRYLVEFSITGFKAGLNKEIPKDGEVSGRLATWQARFDDATVLRVLQSLRIGGKELKGVNAAS